jgi:cytochrome c-type biogenesis protein CcmH/NrfF
MSAALWFGAVHHTSAGEAQPTSADPALEARVNHLSAEMRCLVCQNQSLADSHADLAIDLKNKVREQLKAGRTDRQVIDYMTERYGDFVLYRPPVKATTLLLWGGPLLLLLAGGLLWWRSVGGRTQAADAHTMSAEAQAWTSALLEAVATPQPEDGHGPA